jgi:DNA-binding response OmpR family regulator
MLLLLAEDDRDLAAAIMDYLDLENISCDYAPNGQIALERLLSAQQHYDVIILDINMPFINGITLCQTLRAKHIITPCLMLTARDTLNDKLLGFASGADDYLIKPFAMPELVVRLQALCRRHQATPHVQIADLVLDVVRHQAYRAGELLALSQSEWLLLLSLARASPQIVSREQLEDCLWPDGAPSKDALKMALYRLRHIIDENSHTPLVQTVRGVGVALRP